MIWDEDIIIPLGFFVTTIVISIGVPLVRALGRKWDRQATAAPSPQAGLERIDERLTRIEQAIDSMSIEVERVSEAQRFTTRLLSERTGEVTTGAENRR